MKAKPEAGAFHLAERAARIVKFCKTERTRRTLLCKAVLGSAAFCAALPVMAGCSTDVVDLRWDGGQARFTVEVADDPAERAKGLMFREKLGRYKGMLFIFEQPLAASFWMKNTLIPLDMIFLDQHGVVKKVHPMATPGSLESVEGGQGILSVLEINGGLAAKVGIQEGAQMRHEAFANSAPVWPCD